MSVSRAGARSVRPLHIAATIATLRAGGAERVMSLLCSAWAERGDRVTLITLDDAEPFYALHEAVRRVPLGRMGVTRGWKRAKAVGARWLAVRGAIAEVEPDVCVSFVDRLNVPVLIATRGLGVPCVVSERVHPGFVDDPAWRTVRRATYLLADAVVAQTERTADALRAPGGPPVLTIPNPVTDPKALRASDSSRRLIAAGRLVEQKGFDVLLRAFARVAPDFPEWRLVIHGDGPERPALERLVGALGLAERVSLPGKTADLLAALAQAEVLALPSRFEGFPNVLCEGMAVGLACVASRCLTGPEEIVTDGVDGFLVPPEDVGALACALRRLLAEPDTRRALGERALSVRERLGLPRVLECWDEAFARAGAR